MGRGTKKIARLIAHRKAEAVLGTQHEVAEILNNGQEAEPADISVNGLHKILEQVDTKKNEDNATIDD